MDAFIVILCFVDFFCLNWAVGLTVGRKLRIDMNVECGRLDVIAFYSHLTIVIIFNTALYLYSYCEFGKVYFLAIAAASVFGVMAVAGVYAYGGRAIMWSLPILLLCRGLPWIQHCEVVVNGLLHKRRSCVTSETVLLAIIGLLLCACFCLVLTSIFQFVRIQSLELERDNLLKVQSEYFGDEPAKSLDLGT